MESTRLAPLTTVNNSTGQLAREMTREGVPRRHRSAKTLLKCVVSFRENAEPPLCLKLVPEGSAAGAVSETIETVSLEETEDIKFIQHIQHIQHTYGPLEETDPYESDDDTESMASFYSTSSIPYETRMYSLNAFNRDAMLANINDLLYATMERSERRLKELMEIPPLPSLPPPQTTTPHSRLRRSYSFPTRLGMDSS